MSLNHGNPAQNIVVGAGKQQSLLEGASSTVTGQAVSPQGACKSIQVSVTGSWTATTVIIQVSLDGTNWFDALTIDATEYSASNKVWENKSVVPYVRAKVSAYNATTGNIAVTMYS